MSFPFASPRVPSAVRGFTLVEMMVVLAIVGILASLGMGAFASVTRARGVVNGGNLVAGLVNQARQNSISKGVMTALVMAKAVPEEDFNYAAFALVEKAPNDDAWTPVTPWAFLPRGIVADPGRSASFAERTPVFTLPPTEGLERLPGLARGVSLPPTAWAYQVFLPTGRLSINGLATTSDLPTLYLVEKGRGGASKNYYKVEINLLTGSPHIERP